MLCVTLVQEVHKDPVAELLQIAEVHLAMKFSCLLPANGIYTHCSVVQTPLRTGLSKGRSTAQVLEETSLAAKLCWGN